MLKEKQLLLVDYGSGSHLMSYVNAENHKWDTVNDLNFKVVKNLDGAVETLTNDEADYFLWGAFYNKTIS